MKKLALFLSLVLCLGLMTPFVVLADEPAATETDTSNLVELANPGFEENGGWTLGAGSYITDEHAHTGTHSVALPTVEGGEDPDCYATITGLVEGATYEISGWIKNTSGNRADIGFWLYYSSKDKYDHGDSASQLGIEKGTTRWQIDDNGHFQRYAGEFTPPKGTQSIMIYVRHRLSPGEIYVDDIEIRMVKSPTPIIANTDAVFYYSEWPTGELSGYPKLFDDAAKSKAEVSLVKPDGTETHQETITDLSNGVKYVFRTEWMEEKGQRYTVRLKVFGPDGAELQNEEWPVYRFDRPTYLGADGVFRKNGKEYNITTGAGVSREYMDTYNPEDGVQIIQLIASGSVEKMRENMDVAYEKGLLCFINLYYANDCGGDESRRQWTLDIVNGLKDHPALFGYKIQDEPYQKGNSEEAMEWCYATVRNLDPNHVVYASESVPGGLEWMFRYCDMFDTAYYLGGNDDAGRRTSDVCDIAMEASKGRKPFSVCMQALPLEGYLPSVDEMRHMMYQAFFSGASGVEFHSLGIDSHGGNDKVYMSRPEWKDLVEKWAPWERDFMYDCFVNGKYKFLNYIKTHDIMWATFTDDKDIYAICLNRNKYTPTTAEIPLVDGSGIVNVDAFTATRAVGKEETITGNGTLSLNLEPWEAAVWKITPANPIDTSSLKVTKYRDMLSYSWAYNAVATLQEKGIVNSISDNWYGPGQNITRGDYAMFLVRALGLTATAGENFADVDANAEYANELAIGKAAGILQGVGDNQFNPEAEVTRQDMMTMTSRAMSLAGTADLSGFSDNASIADYAQAHVSAMVAAGLIKGNADGTINPLGNTTRAEAAVIMNRIIAQ